MNEYEKEIEVYLQKPLDVDILVEWLIDNTCRMHRFKKIRLADKQYWGRFYQSNERQTIDPIENYRPQKTVSI